MASPWLDTETKALLKKSPPLKLAPPDTSAFSLILLSLYRYDVSRLLRAVARIRSDTDFDFSKRLRQKLPIIVKDGLSHNDALVGQFELISCDAISVYIPDRVIRNATCEYLNGLFDTLLKSEEFAESKIEIDAIPDDEKGHEFIDQFLGKRHQIPSTLRVPYKKARIMAYWGNRIGGRIRLLAGSRLPS